MSAPTVLFLGPAGTYSHQAAHDRFGQDAIYNERSSIPDVFSSISEQEIGVVPQENSIFGSVIETYDCLRQKDSYFVHGEITIGIQHCLLVRKGTKMEDIDCIMSHEQALGQCKGYISRKYPNVTVKKTTSTAAAARQLLENPANCAAICSKICATIVAGIEILDEGIQDAQDNFTRFYIISRERHVCPPPPSNVTRKSALLRISEAQDMSVFLALLRKLTLRVRRIDRRPSLQGLPFEDTYFIEVQDGTEGREEATWKNTIEGAVAQATDLGIFIEVVGLW